MAILPEHLKGNTVHIVVPNDDYDEEEGSDGEIDPKFDQINLSEYNIRKPIKPTKSIFNILLISAEFLI